MSSSEQTIKILTLGGSGVGKTSVLIRFVDNRFDTQMRSTIGLDFRNKVVMCNGQKVKLSLWDTAGQEQFRCLSPSCFRGSNAVILMYDVTDRKTFDDDMPFWLQELGNYQDKEDVVLMLVGNKIDMEDSRVVSTEEGKQFARDHSMLFIECSAKATTGVHEAFMEVVQKVLDTRAESGANALRHRPTPSTSSSSTSGSGSGSGGKSVSLKDDDHQGQSSGGICCYS